MAIQPGQLIIYDGNCKICSSAKDFLIRFASVPPDQIQSYQELSPVVSAMIDFNQFKNGMAFIDLNQHKVVYGSKAVTFIFSAQFRLMRFLLRFSFFYFLFYFLYQVISYNRYIIATPKSKFQCDCFPDKIAKYRIAYISIMILFATFLTACVGISLRAFVDPSISASKGAFQFIVIAGTGWIIQIIFAILFLKDRALDYIGHLGTIMVVGLLIWIPWILIYLITHSTWIYFPIITACISSGTMLYLHIHRTRYLDLSFSWTLSWFLALQVGAWTWIYFFFIN